MALDLSKLR